MRKYPSVPQPSAACRERLVRQVRPVPTPAGQRVRQEKPAEAQEGTPPSAMVHRIPAKPNGIEDETKVPKTEAKTKT